MRTFTQNKLTEILEKHRLWLNDEEGGERADLSFANLRSADLRFADLSSADLSSADLSFANLRSANLSSADLSFANLRSAGLWGTVGNLDHIKSLFIQDYPITYTADYLQIGCERHAINDWWEFNDRRILEMEGKQALEFWRGWKLFLKDLIEKSPATPTKLEETEEAEATA